MVLGCLARGEYDKIREFPANLKAIARRTCIVITSREAIGVKVSALENFTRAQFEEELANERS